jgi:transcriptional regulator with XRE-family HTH domain
MDATSDATRGPRLRGQLLRLRGRADLTQSALAALLGISEKAIQNWEAGRDYPSAAGLQALIALYLQRQVFLAGREEEQARVLWAALRREASQRTSPFDAAWFATLRPAAPEAPAGPGAVPVTVASVFLRR